MKQNSNNQNVPRISVQHYRYSLNRNALLPLQFFRATGTQDDISPKGGMTIASTFIGGKRYAAVAECSFEDGFVNSRGNAIARARLMPLIQGIQK